MTLPLLLLAHPALSAAEDDEAFEADPALQHLEELVVTGSRIRRPDLTSASPLVRAEAEDLLSQGTVRVEDTLRSLPQEFTNQNASQSYSATGTATVNLRGLGAKRTLVLVNGRRLPAGLPIQGGGGADINQIPGALIASIDVLTGGASATYGSDAVAGVVNFRQMDDFEGVKLRYQWSQYQHDSDQARLQSIVRNAG